jgi:hypothetical protein
MAEDRWAQAFGEYGGTMGTDVGTSTATAAADVASEPVGMELDAHGEEVRVGLADPAVGGGRPSVASAAAAARPVYATQTQPGSPLRPTNESAVNPAAYAHFGTGGGADSPLATPARYEAPIFLTPAQMQQRPILSPSPATLLATVEPQVIADDHIDPATVLAQTSEHEYLVQPSQLSVVSNEGIYTSSLVWMDTEDGRAPSVRLQNSNASFKNVGQLVSFYQRRDFIDQAHAEGREPDLPTTLGTVRHDTV